MDAQLELFDGFKTAAPCRSRMAGMGALQIRYDHAVLCGMVALIGVAVVFGLGVERGKLLVRSERMLVGPQLGSASASAREPDAAGTTLVTPRDSWSPKGGIPSGVVEGSSARQGQPASTRQEAPATSTQQAAPKTPTKTVAGKSKYAIQVVTYSKMKLARQELSQLLGRGEQAFLIERTDGRMVLCIGPFPTRQHASVKLSRLKQRYQDCFIRSL